MSDNFQLGFAKCNIDKNTNIRVKVFKDGTLYSDQIDFLEGVTIDLVQKEFKKIVVEYD